LKFLSGSSTAAERSEIITEVENGDVDIVVATQAVLQIGVPFKQLGLVIIDEQHKFGVRQRALLRNGNVDPHYLVMTATPIPRTIAMTLYGELDVSVLQQMPPGRSPVKTYWTDEERRAQWWDFFRKKLREGRQGFVVAPLVDEDADELMGAEQVLEHLANGELADFRIDLLHGRMSNDQKQQAMLDFANGKTQILVATTVIEVGIDVPNASVMTIENAERFGLSQLHQLRGRVGRGSHPGFVCVFGNPTTELGKQRLQAFVETSNGFELAEIDFSLRGPGELFGTKQHGMPPLMIANLQRDLEILRHAREDARRIVAEDPNLDGEDLSRLKAMMLKRYGTEMDLSDVG
jgi:ATP-dependent DNA helicase RecG